MYTMRRTSICVLREDALEGGILSNGRFHPTRQVNHRKYSSFVFFMIISGESVVQKEK